MGDPAGSAPRAASIAAKRRGVISRRSRGILRRTALVGALGTAILVSGCGMSAGLNEYVVQFAPGTPLDQARLVGKACPGVGKATLEPPDKNKLATSRAYPVRYDITNASSSDKAALTKCLQQFTIVRGVSESNDDA